MIIKPSISFLTKYSDVTLAQAIATIIAAMTGNPVYTTPIPALTVISTALDAFVQVLADAAGGGTQFTAIKNAKRKAAVDLMRTLAICVTGNCGGDLANLISSGFPIQKPTRARVGMLPAPATPFVSQGSHTGELDAATDAVPNGTSYMWRIAKASEPDVVVQLHPCTSSRFTFDDLTPGQIYIVTVAVLGAAGVSEWSNGGQLMVI